MSGVDLEPLRRQLRLNQSMGRSLEDAGRELVSIGVPPAAVQAAIEEEREEARRQALLTPPHGATALEYQHLVGEARSHLWYARPDDTIDKNWVATRAAIAVGLGDGMEALDSASRHHNFLSPERFAEFGLAPFLTG